MTVSAGASTDVADGQGASELGLQLHYLAERGEHLTLNEARASFEAGGWSLSTDLVPNFGFGADPHWFQVDLTNASATPHPRILEIGYSMLDFLEVYFIDSSGQVSEFKGGDRYPFDTREIEHRYFAYPLQVPAGETLRVFIRVDTTSSLQLPLRLWEPGAFYSKGQTGLFIQGLYFGLILLMILYNLFIYFSVRERAYILYVGYLSALGLALGAMHGIWFQFLWSESLWWQEKCTILCSGLALAFICWFTDEFLQLGSINQLLAKFLRIIAATGMFFGLASLALPYSLLAAPLALMISIGVLSSLGAGVYAWSKGVHSARYFTFGCGSLLLGAALLVLNKNGIIERSFWTENGIQLGSVVEAIFLSLALATRFNLMKEQKERAQGEALRIQTKAAQQLKVEVANQTQELQDKTEKLQNLNDERARFFQNISHELRTPLTLLLGPLDKALRQHGQDESLLVAKENALRLLRLVNQLLDFQKMAAGKMQLDDKPQELVGLLRACSLYFGEAARERGIDFRAEVDGVALSSWDGAEADWVVRGDRDALEKVALNYLANALKFTEAGGEITLGLEKFGQSARLFVQDSGKGITEQDQKALFETFSQLDSTATRAHEGTGLGLSLVKSFTEMMGGHVGLKSEPGVGSRFWVDLPVTQELPVDVSEMTPERAKVHLQGSRATENNSLRDTENNNLAQFGRQETVLVVDDLFQMRQYIREALEPLGYRVLTASMVTEALDLARAEEPDLVITDWMMPEMSGTELIQRLRADEILKSIPTIMLTARADAPSRVCGAEAGASAYLVKPCEKKELIHTVKNLLHLRRAERDRAISGRQRLLGQLSVELAHGLNNPLNFISGGVVNLRTVIEEVDEVLQNLLGHAEQNEQVQEVTQFFESALERHDSILSLITKGTTESGNVVEDLRRLAEADGRVLELLSLEEVFMDELTTLQLTGGSVYEHVRYDINLPEEDSVVANPFVLRQVIQSVMLYCTEQACRIEHDPTVLVSFERDKDGSLLIRSSHNGEAVIGGPRTEKLPDEFGLDVSSRLAFARTLWESQGGVLRLIEQDEHRLELFIPYRPDPT